MEVASHIPNSLAFFEKNLSRGLQSGKKRNDRLSDFEVPKMIPSLQTWLQRIGYKRLKQQELDGAFPTFKHNKARLELAGKTACLQNKILNSVKDKTIPSVRYNFEGTTSIPHSSKHIPSPLNLVL